jgi:hypothetical protein
VALRSPTNTHSFWGSYLFGALPTSANVQVGDTAYATDTATYYVCSAIGPVVWSAVGGGGGSPIIWKWNEVDATQFTTALDEIAFASGGPVITKVTGNDGPRLRVAFPTKDSGTNLAVVTINDLSLPIVLTDVRRYIFKFRLVGFNIAKTVDQWYSIGATLCSNTGVDAALYCQCVTTQFGAAGADRTIQVTAGAKTLAGGTPGWGYPIYNLLTGGTTNYLCVSFDLDVTQRHVVASPPDWRGALEVFVPNGSGASSKVVYQNATREAVTAATTPLTAGWNTQDFQTLGFAFLGTAGSETDHYFEFDQMTVEKCPIDL